MTDCSPSVIRPWPALRVRPGQAHKLLYRSSICPGSRLSLRYIVDGARPLAGEKILTDPRKFATCGETGKKPFKDSHLGSAASYDVWGVQVQLAHPCLPPLPMCRRANWPHLPRLSDRTADNAQLWRVASVIRLACSNLRWGIATLPPQTGVYVPRRLSQVSGVGNRRLELRA